jgi:hypothetical protein
MLSGSYQPVHWTKEYPDRSTKRQIGIPASKPRFRILDITVLLVSFVCCATALLAVLSDHLSWYLGLQYQFVIIGLMMSIMNICLAYSLPFAFLLVEARYGHSTLQNYQAILQNSFFGSHISLVWRLALSFFTIVPLGLSIAYKLFTGGSSTWPIQHIGVEYGMYAPAGLEKVGVSTGFSLMLNTTLPFVQAATAAVDAKPPRLFPDRPSVYGANTLLISRSAAAILDLPSPDFVLSVQEALELGETVHITATVQATVTRQNESVWQYRSPEAQGRNDFWQYYYERAPSTVSVTHVNGSDITMLNNMASVQGDLSQTWLFLAVLTSPSNSSTFESEAYMLSTWREQCKAEWSLTRTSLQLANAACDPSGNLSPQAYHRVYTQSNLRLDIWFRATLAEYLGLFSGPNTNYTASDWMLPTMAVTTAGMMYSRATAVGECESRNSSGCHYPSQGSELFTSTKPTMRFSRWLLLVICLQPGISAITIAATALLHSVPLDRGFGLVSIMAGVDPKSLEHLHGAALSSKLSDKVSLDIVVSEQESGHEIRYVVDGSIEKPRARLRRGEMYT